MKRIFYTFIYCLLLANICQAQDWSLERSVQMTAEIQASPANITINWVSEPANSFTLYKRVKGSNSWGTALANLSNTTFTYEDDNVVVGESYEYRIIKNAPIKGQGAINAGINLPVVEQRGRLILVVDDTHAAALSVKIERLINDVEGDGWSVSRLDVSPSDVVSDVKEDIKNMYETDPDNYKAILLLGHVPVPYAGQNFPDGHPDHEGAWPADLYYGEMNGNWTDVSVNVTVTSDSRNHNVPFDGKFDQTIIPNDIDLQVGRIDFHDLPAFAETEEQLLSAYLDKNHAFRHKEFTAEPRGLLENNFAGLPEGFGQNAYRNFSAMFGVDEVYVEDYSNLFNESYLWSYGAGAGNFTTASGIVTTEELAVNPLQSVFSMTFGSYFGDWDSENNLLRATLASGTVLTSAWAGRPKYQLEHMAMGENIGYGLLLTQNTPTNFVVDTCYGGRLIHIALMGDPTLRMHVVEPPGEVLAISEDNANITIDWDASADAILGYHIYRKEATDVFFERINGDPVLNTSYIDPCRPFNENYIYMVRALKLENSASGSYYNQSQGVMGSATVETDLTVSAEFSYIEDNDMIAFTNISENATNFAWSFGDGSTSSEQNPNHTYASDGVYMVTLTVSNDCFSETYSMDVLSGVLEASEIRGLTVSLSPVPANDFLQVQLSSDEAMDYGMKLINAKGQVLLEKQGHSGQTNTLIIGHLPAGVYWLQIANDRGERAFRKFVII